MKSLPFSHETREEDLAAMARGPVDVLVIGGGITGAGVAREAALRGLRVALVERRDFASGTSSRSSKLIHGGVRYLAQGEVGLVREAAEERRVLRRTAPHLTQPGPMLIPTFSRRQKMKMDAGLWTFEKIGNIPPEERHEVLNAEETLRREPTLRKEDLTGGVIYPENLTDDARLVLATIRSARRFGALVANYAEVVGLDGFEPVARVSVRNVETGETLVVRAAVVVNAGGPWGDTIRSLEGELQGRTLFLTRGVHLVVRHDDLPVRNMVIMQARDKRSVFAIPRGDVVYVGTTDTHYPEARDYPEIDREDVDYLLDAVRRTFPDAGWGPEKIVAAWAGLRPLLQEEGKKPQEISRKDEIMIGPRGMITVTGGKLTTYRKMAEKVLDEVETQLGRSPKKRDGHSRSADEALEGGDLDQPPEDLARVLESRFGEPLSGMSRLFDRLVLHHGSQAVDVLERVRRDGSALLDGSGILVAEIDHAVEHEMVLRLVDVLERRFRLLLFHPGRGLDVADAAARRVGRLLNWSDDRRDREVEDYRRVAEACRPGEENG